MSRLLTPLSLLWLSCAAPALEKSDVERGCESEFEELQITCLVQAAADAGAAGDMERAEYACAAIPKGSFWNEECHFRAGESLARTGRLIPVLSHCDRAGRFGKSCITHAAWALKPDPKWRPGSQELGETLRGFEESVTSMMFNSELKEAARDELLSRSWFLVYFGSGSADPAAAQGATPAQLPYARSAWALEVMRLYRGEDPLHALAALWDGAAEPPTGPALRPEERQGRHSPMPIPAEARERTMIATFGGGRRLVSPDPGEDLLLAGLSALFVLNAPAEAFQPWTEDPRVLVRDQAISALILRAADPDGAAGPFLEHPDPMARAYAREALKVRRDLERKR